MCQETDKAKNVKIKVNGNQIQLNPFSTHIISSVIWVMVTSLKLEEKPSKIEIELSE
jgi:hypothetical protein